MFLAALLCTKQPVARNQIAGRERGGRAVPLRSRTHKSTDAPPGNQRIVDKGLKHCNEAVAVVPQDAHHALASRTVVALDAAHLHGVDKHSGEAEWNLLREFVSVHRHLETVAEVDVEDLSCVAIQHQVRGVPIAQPKDVSDHGHDRKAARVARSTIYDGAASADAIKLDRGV